METLFSIFLSMIISLPFYLLMAIGNYVLFRKAGKKGFLAFIPVVNSITQLKITGKPTTDVVFEFVPIVNVFATISHMVKYLRCFGVTKDWQKTLVITFGYIYLPILANKNSVQYQGEYDAIPEPEKTKSTVQEWADAILFAVVAATLIRWLIMEAFTIPTPSMEKSLLVGDFLFVSKFHYGTRTPKTPLQVPLTHQKIWLTNIPSYVDWIQLPQYRLPGFTEVKRNDVVVFNVPGIDENNFEEFDKSKWIDYPVDLKTNYIKRCVAVPGDVIEVRDQQIYINGEKGENPEGMQFSYVVESKSGISERTLDKNDIGKPEETQYSKNNTALQVFFLTEDEKTKLSELPFVLDIRPHPYKSAQKGEWESNIFPNDKELFPWNGDWYGPLTIPEKGKTIEVNRETLATYGKVITLYDHNDNAIIQDGKLFIDDQEVKQYTFNQDYYFMMGDNRHNSLDSRYWGFVPADHVVGKGFFIWLSLDANESFFSKIRWRRFFNLIE